MRRYSSSDVVAPVADQENVPWYWIRPQRALPATAGMHRFTWDLRYPPLPEKAPSFSIAATPGDTAPDSIAPWAMPGTYTIKLTANGHTFTQPLIVTMDPRVKTSREDLAQQFSLSIRLYQALKAETEGSDRATKLRRLLDTLQSADVAPTAQLVTAVEDALK